MSSGGYSIENYLKERERQALTHSGLAEGSPERAAKALDLQNRSGVPSLVIETDIEYWDQLIKQRERANVVSGSPAVQNFINSDPLAAKVAADELPQLNEALTLAQQYAFPRSKSMSPGDAFTYGFGDEPFSSFDPDTGVSRALQDIGVFNKPGRTFSPAAALIEGPIRAASGAFELFVRTGSGLTSVAASEFGNLMYSMGLADSPKEVQDEILGLAEAAGVVYGMKPYYPGVFKRRRTAQQNRMVIETEYIRVAAERQAEKLDQAVEATQALQTRERAPLLVNQALARETNGAEIVIDSDTLLDYYESQGITPGNGDPVFGWYPGIDRALLEPELIVPLATYLTYVDPKVHAKIYPSIRNVTGMSLRQVDELQFIVEKEIESLAATEKETVQQLQKKTVQGPGGVIVAGEHIPVGATPEVVSAVIDRRFVDAIATRLKLKPDDETVDELAGQATQSVEEAARTRKALYLDSVFETAEAAGMTKEEFRVFSKAVEDRVKADEARAVEQAIRQARRETNKEWKDAFAVELARAEKEFDERADIIADRTLRAWPEEQKITTDEFQVNKNAPKGTTSSIGRSADDVAADLGFPNGEALVNALDALARDRGRKRVESYRAKVTRSQARQATRDKLDDPINVYEDKVDAATNDDVTRVLYDDLRVMRRQNENELSPPLGLDELKRKMAEVFNGLPVKYARRLATFLRPVADLGRRALVEAVKGEPIKAFKAKNQQLMAVLKLKEAGLFYREYTKNQKLVKKYTKRAALKAVDPEFTVHIQMFLENFGIATKRKRGPEGQLNLREFITRRSWQGEIYPADDFLFEKGMTVDTMTVAQFRAFDEMLTALDKQGRKAKTVYEAGRTVSIETAKAEMLNAIIASKDIMPYQERQTVRKAGRSGERFIARVERIFDRIEMFMENGPFQRYIIRPLNEGEFTEAKLLEKANNMIKTKVEKPGKYVDNDFVTITGDPRRLTRADVILMALNAGNRRNRDLLVDTLLPVPPTYGPLQQALTRPIREKQVLDFIKRTLTENDWKHIDEMWAYFAWLKPQIDALYLRMTGKAPDTVVGIDTLGHKGGYFPILRSKLQTGATPHEKLSPFEADWHPVTTPNGHTKPRTQSSDALMIEGANELLPSRINAWIHDLAMREPIQNAHKLLSDKQIQLEIARRYGVEYAEGLDRWLRSIANRTSDSDRALGAIARLSRALRLGFVSVTIPFNILTIITPTYGKNLSHPLSTMWAIRNFPEFAKFAELKSGTIHDRRFYQQSDLYDVQRQILGMQGRWTGFQRNGAYFGTWLLYKIDYLSAVVGWNYHYNQAIKNGVSDSVAVELADKYVRDWHTSVSPVNRAQIFNEGEQMRNLGLFYSWANSQYNLTRGIVDRGAVTVRQMKKGDYAGAKRNFALVLANTFAAVIVPILTGQLFYTELKDDDSALSFMLRAVTGYMAQLFPIIRDLQYYRESGQRPSASVYATYGIANIDAFEAMLKAFEGEADSDIWIKKTANALAIDLGIPGGSQFSRSGYFLWGVANGDINPQTPMEWARGIIRGYPKSGGGMR